MKVRPILFVCDLPEAIRFYEALGLEVEAQSRSGHWLELRAGGGELGLHGPVQGQELQPGVRLGFVTDEPLEEVEQRLRAAGFLTRGSWLTRSGAAHFWCMDRTEPSCRSTSRTVELFQPLRAEASMAGGA